jgi:hypothetical protein
MSISKASNWRPRQTPYKRRYPTGRIAWIARYFDEEGKACYAKPDWNDGKSSFSLRREAQQAIDEALKAPQERERQRPASARLRAGIDFLPS